MCGDNDRLLQLRQTLLRHAAPDAQQPIFDVLQVSRSLPNQRISRLLQASLITGIDCFYCPVRHPGVILNAVPNFLIHDLIAQYLHLSRKDCGLFCVCLHHAFPDCLQFRTRL